MTGWPAMRRPAFESGEMIGLPSIAKPYRKLLPSAEKEIPDVCRWTCWAIAERPVTMSETARRALFCKALGFLSAATLN